MATANLQAPIPSIVLPPGAKIRFEAISPTTGAAVGGVTVRAISIAGPAAGAQLLELQPGAFMLVPGPGE